MKSPFEWKAVEWAGAIIKTKQKLHLTFCIDWKSNNKTIHISTKIWKSFENYFNIKTWKWFSKDNLESGK